MLQHSLELGRLKVLLGAAERLAACPATGRKQKNRRKQRKDSQIKWLSRGWRYWAKGGTSRAEQQLLPPSPGRRQQLAGLKEPLPKGSVTMEEVESRFLHLLQPIRDLTKNWEVDVAAQLGEYLEELDQICISFDGGKTTMNFIEAALLIQGSACIYSRKVEYLYSLVYQALDFISNKKRDKQPTSVGEDGTDADVSAGPRKEEEEFLSLDDIKDTNVVSVDMKKDHQPNTVNIVPLTPMALVPPEETEKKDNPLFSRKGEILASRKDFRMNTCTPHANGAFMLELAGLSPTQYFQTRRQAGDLGSATGGQTAAPGSGNAPMDVSACETPIPVLNFSENEGTVAPDEGGGGDNDDDAGRGGDFLSDAPEGGVETSPAAVEHIQQQKEMLDPWRSLDPFDDSEDKPFKKGRPFTVPRELDDVPGRKRKRWTPRKLQDFMKWFSASQNDRADSRTTKKKGPTFADLEVLYWKQLKERMAAQRKLQRRMGLLLGKHLQEEEQLEEAEEELNAVEEERLDDYLDYDGGADDFLEQEDVHPAALEQLAEGDLGPCTIPDTLSYEELVRRNVELFIANSQKYARETVLSQRIRDWEDKMEPKLQDQEERAAFDIHSYGDQLAASCGRLGEWHTFASLVAGKPAFEVCRSMLASLQLANDYTVEISQQPGLEEAVDTMRLRLLTQERAHERFRTYMAPSVSN
ncbi:condensin-2 complex subunit H2 isoform X2 [Gopherus flavomarginatus]|uniref:condensin-2 complex subunit H2 isoform X2 n=1 Tax=Gopherus flavomarginatus TaxID=286002 RepID=UPI0021CBCAE2|nr:condensin-2 complex subunit H2 isoform X2 [Gopherus flavomarginatus]